MLVLSIIQGPDKGRTFELPDDEPQLLGRSSEALPLTDNTVSRRHSELTPDGPDWFVRDLGSQNGTWLNGVRIEQRTKLKPGDQIRAGSTLMIFGRSAKKVEASKVRILRSDRLDTMVEHTMPSNDDSVILAEPEPRHAAADHLRILYKLTTLTTQIPDRQQLLEGAMELVFSEFRPERGCIMLIDGVAAAAVNQSAPSTQSAQSATGLASQLASDESIAKARPVVVRYSSERGSRPGTVQDEMHLSRSILQHVLLKGEGVLSSNALSDPRFNAGDSVVRLNIRSAVCSPIKFRSRTFGAIYIDSSVANYTFTTDQLALLNAVGQHSGLALANAELYQQKLQAERLAAVGETVASLSHSIKNILQGLRGGADVVELGLKKNDLKVATGGWNILRRNLDRIIGLTLNMLAYSRPRTLEMELIKVGVLLDDCAGLLKDRCLAKGVVLIIDADPEMPPVPMDAHQMHQALMNLMTNAVEAVEPKTGVVTVKATFVSSGNNYKAGTGEGRIALIDNGPGIAPEMFEKIFEPFFTTKGMRGTGLGLAVTRRIIQQHGGKLELISQLGKGTTFTVLLPVDPGSVIDPSETTANRSMAASGFDISRFDSLETDGANSRPLARLDVENPDLPSPGQGGPLAKQ